MTDASKEVIYAALKEFQAQTEARYRELGMIDGLMLAAELLGAHPEAALVCVRVANGRLERLNADLDRELQRNATELHA